MGEMQKVPSAVPFRYRAVRWLPLTILHIAIFMLLFLRRPDSLLNPQLWAEDLLVFFMDDTRLGFWRALDRKSTRLNSSHANISYAVFCLKKKQKQDIMQLNRH